MGGIAAAAVAAADAAGISAPAWAVAELALKLGGDGEIGRRAKSLQCDATLVQVARSSPQQIRNCPTSTSRSSPNGACMMFCCFLVDGQPEAAAEPFADKTKQSSCPLLASAVESSNVRLLAYICVSR